MIEMLVLGVAHSWWRTGGITLWAVGGTTTWVVWWKQRHDGHWNTDTN